MGDWNATGKSYIGVTNGQQWYLDGNGNGVWDGADKGYNFGASGWIPKVGDWNGDGRTKIGVTNSQQWYLDTNGNGLWDIQGIDYVNFFGAPRWTPIVGKWDLSPNETVRLNGTLWHLTGYVFNGTPAQVLNGTSITLNFGDEGHIYGSAGCNQYQASCDVNGTAITTGDISTTMILCEPPGIMTQEGSYLTLLKSAKTYSIDSNRLSLLDGKGATILSFLK